MTQLPLDLQFISTPGREDFILGDCNRVAASWIDRWPDWPGQYRVLNLVGAQASGKSHLAAIWTEQADAVTLHGVGDDTMPPIWCSTTRHRERSGTNRGCSIL